MLSTTCSLKSRISDATYLRFTSPWSMKFKIFHTLLSPCSLSLTSRISSLQVILRKRLHVVLASVSTIWRWLLKIMHTSSRSQSKIQWFDNWLSTSARIIEFYNCLTAWLVWLKDYSQLRSISSRKNVRTLMAWSQLWSQITTSVSCSTCFLVNNPKKVRSHLNSVAIKLLLLRTRIARRNFLTFCNMQFAWRSTKRKG